MGSSSASGAGGVGGASSALGIGLSKLHLGCCATRTPLDAQIKFGGVPENESRG